ncbi:MAG: PDZ domain-containing protein [Ignavibacteriae bacterium]|nr:PDZ domain-containing protein [Ignavibacteriota bacterium]
MHRQLISLFGILLLLFATEASPSQVIIKREAGKGAIEEQPVVLMEAGAIMVMKDGSVIVDHLLPKDRLPKGSQAVDLKEGDVILMANGKKLKSAKELEGFHASLAVGGELKLGVQRGDQKFIVAVTKADPKDLPQMRIKIGGGGGEDLEALPAVGVVLKSLNNKILVDAKFPDSTSALASANVKQNDQLVEMNKHRISTMKQLMDDYSGLPIGSKVEWKLKRGSETITVNFIKPKPRQGVIRREIKN